MPTCPHCGHDADASADECPLCGTPLDGGAAPAEAGRGGDAAEEPVPWEDPDRWVLGGLLATWKRSLFEPERFFGALDHEKPLARPLLYYLLVTVVSGFFSLLWQTAFQSLVGVPSGGRQAAGDLLLSYFLTPFVSLLVLLVGGGLVHLSVTILASERMRPARATYRVLCYAAGPWLLGIVPVVGGVVAPAWSLVLAVVGLRRAHRTNTGLAVLSVLAPVVALVVVLVLLVALVVSASELGELYPLRP